MSGAGDAPKVRLIEPTDPPSQEWLAQVARIVNASVSSGTTGQRPTAFLFEGRFYWDSTLGKPVFVKSLSPTVWVDATGTPI